MPAIRIQDGREDGGLDFDLREILIALGQSAFTSFWSVGNVESQNEHLDATAEGAEELEKLAQSGLKVSDSHLLRISHKIKQVIWGEFRGYENKTADIPHLVIIAFDSTYYEVQSTDRKILEKFGEYFRHIDIV